MSVDPPREAGRDGAGEVDIPNDGAAVIDTASTSAPSVVAPSVVAPSSLSQKTSMVVDAVAVATAPMAVCEVAAS